MRRVDFSLGDSKFLFDSNGSVAATGEILKSGDLSDVVLQTIGSESWFSEESDLFRFTQSRQLHSLVLSLPAWNEPIEAVIPESQKGYFSLELSSEKNSFIVPPQTFRFFDISKRRLICFSRRDSVSDLVRFNLTNNLSLLFDGKDHFFGWIFVNPLESMVETFQSEKDSEPADDLSYEIFGEILKVFSDDQCKLYDDDMGAVVKQLLKDVTQEKISFIKGRERQKIINKAMMNLKAYF